MKAKIKATGEIVNIAEYARIALDQCDSWGCTIEVKPEDVELIQEQTENEHWKDVRERAAIAAMQGMLSNSNLCLAEGDTYPKIAVAYSDALIEELKKK